MAVYPLGAWALVDGGSDLHPLVSPWGLGEASGLGPGAAERGVGHGLPGRNQSSGSLQSRWSEEKGTQERSETTVKRLAALVADMGPKPA